MTNSLLEIEFTNLDGTNAAVYRDLAKLDLDSFNWDGNNFVITAIDPSRHRIYLLRLIQYV